jgi:hypothetical protein
MLQRWNKKKAKESKKKISGKWGIYGISCFSAL